MAGGEIAGKADPKTGAIKPQTAVYEVIIPIENPKLTLQPGLRGFAKIDGGTHTFGWWLWRLHQQDVPLHPLTGGRGRAELASGTVIPLKTQGPRRSPRPPLGPYSFPVPRIPAPPFCLALPRARSGRTCTHLPRRETRDEEGEGRMTHRKGQTGNESQGLNPTSVSPAAKSRDTDRGLYCAADGGTTQSRSRGFIRERRVSSPAWDSAAWPSR